MPDWSRISQLVLFNNRLSDWLWAALAFLLTFTVLPVVRSYLRAQARKHAARGLPVPLALIAHLMDRTSRLVLWTIALFAAERFLTWPARIDRAFDVAIVVGVWLQAGLWLIAAIGFGLRRRSDHGHNAQLAGSMSIVMFVAQLVVWALVLLLALGNLGVNITALLAGLGVGGIAIALAVQTILGDLFASLSIALDKPFTIGDALRIDDIEGTVEQIGIKSTRLRSVTGEQIIVANADMLKSRVRNLGRMNERRVLFRLAVSYDTPQAQLDQVSDLVQAAVAAETGTRYVYCHLKELGESALLYEVCFYVANSGGVDVVVVTDAVNRRILRSFNTAGVQFAYPTRTLLLRDQRKDS
ncbi:MAG: mechanosensitive ion channel [Steroidobacteraceae bacterium]